MAWTPATFERFFEEFLAKVFIKPPSYSIAMCPSKEDDFIGKDNLIERKANPQRKLVGLEIEGNEICGHGDCVHPSGNGREQIGIITSGMKSPVLNKNIALCRMNINYCELDTEVEIGKLDGHQKRIKAKVVPFPFYDPTKSRVRA